MSDRRLARRIEPLIPYLVTGEIPMDADLARGVAAYLEEHHRRESRR